MVRHRFVADPHEAVSFRDDLTWLADAWTDLLDRLGRDTPPPDGQPRPASRAVGLVINERVSELMREVTRYARELAGRLAAETTDFHLPASPDTPTMLLAVARRVGHFTNHPDPEVRQGARNRACGLRRDVLRMAYPDGVRTVHLGAYRCLARVVADDGRVQPCPGHWTIRPLPTGALGDMRCSVNPEHTVAPMEWMRVVRRRARFDAVADELTGVLLRSR
jgi:hypothetical protein